MPHPSPVLAPALDRAALCAAVARLQGQRVLILGDVMLDVYLEGDAERISPEAPVPVVNISGERRMLGGAGNVAHNIRSLGGEPHLISLCGAGRDGATLKKLLHDADIAFSLRHFSGRRTIVKTRVMARGQQMLRLDKEDCRPPSPEETQALLCNLETCLPTYNVLVISDYAKGVITPTLREAVGEIVRALPRPVRILVDPKPRNAACYYGVSLMTPNRHEAGLMAGMELRTREDILQAGRKILRDYGCAQLLITLGGQGMALFLGEAGDGAVWNIPTAAKAVFDVTGAGDTVIATVALALAGGLALPEACALANYAAGGVVEHVGVTTLSQSDLCSLVEQGATPHFEDWTQA